MKEAFNPSAWEKANFAILALGSNPSSPTFERHDRREWSEREWKHFVYHVRNEPPSHLFSFNNELAKELDSDKDVDLQNALSRAHYNWHNNKTKFLKPAESEMRGESFAYLQDNLLLVVWKRCEVALYQVYQLPPRMPVYMRSIFGERVLENPDRARLSEARSIRRDLKIKSLNVLPRPLPLSVTGPRPSARFQQVVDGVDAGYFEKILPIPFDAGLPFVTKIKSNRYVTSLQQGLEKRWKGGETLLFDCGAGKISIALKKHLEACWYRGWSNGRWKRFKDVLKGRDDKVRLGFWNQK